MYTDTGESYLKGIWEISCVQGSCIRQLWSNEKKDVQIFASGDNNDLFLDLNKTQAQELKPDNMLRPVMSSSVCQNVLMKVIYSRVWRDQSIIALCVHVCVCVISACMSSCRWIAAFEY